MSVEYDKQVDSDLPQWRTFEPLDLTPLLEAALEAFYEHGFHGTTVRDIARRVGQTVPSLYYHHENKEGVFVAVLDKGTGEIARKARLAAESSPDPVVQFENVIRAVVLYMTHRVKIARLDMELRYLSDEPRKTYAASRKEIELTLLGVIQRGVKEGAFGIDDAEETTRAILGMCQSIARWYHEGGPLTPEEVADRYVRIASRMVGSTRAG